jgi:hypothetical protein
MSKIRPNCGAGGLVPREAYSGDQACVTRAVHDQTIADNTAAPSRTRPNGSCIEGYVWREANASDHVCVTPPTRAQVHVDNATVQCAAGSRDIGCQPSARSKAPPRHWWIRRGSGQPTISRPAWSRRASTIRPPSHPTTRRGPSGHAPVFRGSDRAR